MGGNETIQHDVLSEIMRILTNDKADAMVLGNTEGATARHSTRPYKVDKKGTLTLSGACAIKKKFDEIFTMRIYDNKDVNVLPFILLNRTLLGGAVEMEDDARVGIVDSIVAYRGNGFDGIIDEISDVAMGKIDGTAIASILGVDNVKLLDSLPILREGNWNDRKLSLNPAKTWMMCYDKKTVVEQCLSAACKVTNVCTNMTFEGKALSMFTDDIIIFTRAIAMLWVRKLLYSNDEECNEKIMKLINKSLMKDGNLSKYLHGEIDIKEYCKSRLSMRSKEERYCDYEARTLNELVYRVLNHTEASEMTEEAISMNTSKEGLCHSISYLHTSLCVLVAAGGYTETVVHLAKVAEEGRVQAVRSLSEKEAELRKVSKELSEKSSKLKDMEKRAKRDDKIGNGIRNEEYEKAIKKVAILEEEMKEAGNEKLKLSEKIEKDSEEFIKVVGENAQQIEELGSELGKANEEIGKLKSALKAEQDKCTAVKDEIAALRRGSSERGDFGYLDIHSLSMSISESDKLIKMLTEENKKLRDSVMGMPAGLREEVEQMSIEDIVRAIESKNIYVVSSTNEIGSALWERGLTRARFINSVETAVSKGDCDVLVIPTRLLMASTMKELSKWVGYFEDYVYTDGIDADSIIRDIYVETLNKHGGVE